MPSEALRHVRYAIETVRGTGVTATHILDIESAELEHNVPVVRSANLTGGVFPSPTIIPGVEMNRIKVKLGHWNWDVIQKFLASAFDGTITSAGAGADKTWATGAIKPPALSTGGALTEALKSFTFECGWANPAAATPAFKLAGCVVERIKLNFAPRGFVTGEIDFITLGTVTDLTAFSGVLTPVAPTAIPDFSGYAFYVDTATIGSTADTAIIGAEWEWNSFMVVDENRKRLAIGKQADWSLKLTRFWEASNAISAYRAKTLQKVRAKVTGPSLGASNYQLWVDAYGVIESRSLGSISGFVSEELNLTPKYDATAATDVSIGLVNAQAAL